MSAEDQSAVASICFVVTPAIDAADAAAPLVEWAEKWEVSTQAEVRTDFSQCTMVEEATGACGFDTAKIAETPTQF